MLARQFIVWGVEGKDLSQRVRVCAVTVTFNRPLVLAPTVHAFTKRLVAHSPSSRGPGPGLDRLVSPRKSRTDFAASIS
jgi:hypothetical protein